MTFIKGFWSWLYFCHGDITKLGTDAIVISADKALIARGVISGAIYETAGPGLLNGCKIGECKATLGYKLPA